MAAESPVSFTGSSASAYGDRFASFPPPPALRTIVGSRFCAIVSIWWDGMCSCLRSYSEGELRELVEGLEHEGYRFTISRSRGMFLRVTSLVGEPIPDA